MYEYCIDKPSRENNWKWCWGIYIPEACWAPTNWFGYANTAEQAAKDAVNALWQCEAQDPNTETYKARHAERRNSR